MPKCICTSVLSQLRVPLRHMSLREQRVMQGEHEKISKPNQATLELNTWKLFATQAKPLRKSEKKKVVVELLTLGSRK